MIKFQSGAFALGRPVLPILLRYPYAHCNPAWTLADTAWLLLRVFSQVYTLAEVEVMPLRYPSMVRSLVWVNLKETNIFDPREPEHFTVKTQRTL